MAAADVKVRIYKKEVEKISMLVADVSGEFDMVCSAAPGGGEDLDVVFPIDYEDARPPTPVRFDVAVDGKPVSDVKTDTWSVTDEHNRPRTQWGYAWRLPALKGGQKRHVAVRYSIVLPQKEGRAHFTYFLRSGARWDGPIGREAVNVTADKSLRIEVLGPAALKPEHRPDNSLTWTITNAKPAEDIQLVIESGAKP